MTGPRKYTKTKTVSFYTLTYVEGRKRHYIDEGAIDWSGLFESWKDRPRSDFTLEGIEYEPRVRDGIAVLIMHKPLSSDFLTKGGETGPRVDAELSDEEALRRFACPCTVRQAGRPTRSLRNPTCADSRTRQTPFASSPSSTTHRRTSSMRKQPPQRA